MMEDDMIIELHRALQEARGGSDTRSERYKMHMAKVQDIRDLSELDDGSCNQDQDNNGNGWNSAKIAQILNLPIEMVETERAHIDRHNQMRRKFPELVTWTYPNYLTALPCLRYSRNNL